MSSAQKKESPDNTQLQGLHKQNGVVERKNRTLVEAARTMLNEAKTTPVLLG